MGGEEQEEEEREEEDEEEEEREEEREEVTCGCGATCRRAAVSNCHSFSVPQLYRRCLPKRVAVGEERG